MARHMRALLNRAESRHLPLLFAAVVGASAGMRRSAGWAALLELAASGYGRAHWSIPLHQHGYTQGHAHIAPAAEATRMSSCESAVFIFATSAAAAAWPATPAKEEALRAGFRMAVPRKLHKATKANRKVHQQRKKDRLKSRRRGEGGRG